MEIKNFDMVEYKGKVRRVMISSPHDNSLYLAGYGWVPQDDIKLVESVVIETRERKKLHANQEINDSRNLYPRSVINWYYSRPS